VPKAKSEIFSCIHAGAPYRSRPVGEIKWYYTQALRVLVYAPSIEAQVLELAIDRALEMDVEIKISDNGDASLDREEDEESPDLSQIFELDTSTPIKSNKMEKLKMEATVNEMAAKLDAMMLLLFQHISKATNLKAIFEILLDVFNNSILITHKSKFVQFLLLYICWLGRNELVVVDQYGGEDFMDRAFVSNLIQVLLSSFKSKVTRQTSACYLASFISRANFCSPRTVCQAIHTLLLVADAYAKSAKTIMAADARDQSSLHSLYYTVAQAAFYIMCFRGSEAWQYFKEEASEDSCSDTDIGTARWQTLCSHELNPLKYCLESVRSEFLKLAEAYNLLSEDLRQSIMDDLSVKKVPKRKRIMKITTPATAETERLKGGVGGLGKGSNPLDSFFPFDPYLLHDSHFMVEPIYRHWHGSAVANLDLDTDELTEQKGITYDSGMIQEDSDVSLGDNETENSDRDDNDEEEEEEHDDEEDEAVNSVGEDTASLQPMSYTSRGSFIAESLSNVHVELGVDFTEAMRRPRAQSIENGSLW
jgi:RNA polymerase I-specific transcription initiation factor RRN3